MTLPQIPSGDRNEKAVLLYLYTSPQQTAVDVCGVVDDIDAGSKLYLFREDCRGVLEKLEGGVEGKEEIANEIDGSRM
ncbi:hypothetical protein C0Q70_09689 [Pomacea canaliculata]|uniref:Uncharacterized protein n=1 Tax=Pomacea canaliculata TaxID=400727 RepID=A0A2T7PAI7_POMCA|nr:hypothetical protein C0Q70_09689 [Pomacea canaliculata]